MFTCIRKISISFMLPLLNQQIKRAILGPFKMLKESL
jgi:hypothetical protein